MAQDVTLPAGGATLRPLTYDVCGVAIAALRPASAAAMVVAAASIGASYQVHLCNAYTLSLVGRDSTLAQALSRADLNLPDGTPVAWLGRRRGTAGPVRGPSLVGDVVAQGVAAGIRHYFYGGAEGVADLVAARLARYAPGFVVVGTETPPYRELTDLELDQLAERIDASGASVVWIGIGTPRQDYLVPVLAARVKAVVVPVGAAFDFWSGRVAEAPALLHGSGIEWAYRLTREPARLWRRYFFGNPRFVWETARHRLSGGGGRR
jgi:N-acetylglucosaminyldiphosphoundecaprenol N-acetyl-beta-D-mannosaminyltransferase